MKLDLFFKKNAYNFALVAFILLVGLLIGQDISMDKLNYDTHFYNSYVPNFNTETGMINGVTYSYSQDYDIFEIASLDTEDVNKTIKDNLKPLRISILKWLVTFTALPLLLLFFCVLFINRHTNNVFIYSFIVAFLIIVKTLIAFTPLQPILFTSIPYDFSVSDKVEVITEEKVVISMDMYRDLQLSNIPEFAFVDVNGTTDEFKSNYYKFDSIDDTTNSVIYVQSSNEELLSHKDIDNKGDGKDE